MSVDKYEVFSGFTIGDKLLLPGDILYIESVNPSRREKQYVFREDRKKIGIIDNDEFYKLEKKFLKLIEIYNHG